VLRFIYTNDIDLEAYSDILVEVLVLASRFDVLTLKVFSLLPLLFLHCLLLLSITPPYSHLTSLFTSQRLPLPYLAHHSLLLFSTFQNYLERIVMNNISIENVLSLLLVARQERATLLEASCIRFAQPRLAELMKDADFPLVKDAFQ